MEMGKELPLELELELPLELELHLTPKWTSRSSRSRAMRKIKNLCIKGAPISFVKTGIWQTWKNSILGRRLKKKGQRNNRQARESKIRQTRLTKREKIRAHSMSTQRHEQT
jgi:hypothetical protein